MRSIFAQKFSHTIKSGGVSWDAVGGGGGTRKHTLINSSFGTRSGGWDALGWDALNLGRGGTRKLGRAQVGTRSSWDAIEKKFHHTKK